MFRVKICGITNWPDARRAIEAGCDALGFNFYSRSPRYVSPKTAAEIRVRLPREIVAVGVFVNESPAGIADLARAVGLTYVQLHGEERPASVRAAGRAAPVIKAFRVGPRFRAAQLARYTDAAAFLLDAYRPELRGGTGHIFDWRVARAAASYGRIVLAGGLTPENVAEAIRTARPAAVDTASGVEKSPGHKDPARLRAFLDAVASVQEAFQ
jgi:phosphoribosylanthranilate isomerase